MAHSKSAEKRTRQNAKQRLRNRSARSAERTSVKKFRAAVAAADVETAAKAFHDAQKRVDANAAKGIIRKGTAARIKSRLAANLNTLRTSKA